MGTELAARSVALPGREWSAHALDAAPEVVRAIHRTHVAAGVDVLRANTFRTTRRASGERWRDRLNTAVRLAREAARGQRIAGVLAPLEDCYRPELSPPPDEAQREHAELASALKDAGVDLLWCETFPHPGEARIATAAAAATGLEVWTSLTAGPDATLLTPAQLRDAARTCVEAGASAVLVNCVAAARIRPYVEALAGLGVPFGAYANAASWGEPACSPEAYADSVREWRALGATLIGTCCGNTLAHLRATGAALGRHRLWLARPLPPTSREAALAVLSDGERTQHDRFRFERDRDLYLTAHRLLREALSADTDRPPASWRFVEGPHGRPALSPETPGPSFNLSHTHGLTAVVLGPAAELGVDTEQVGQRGDLLPVAEHWFNAEEVAVLRALPESERQRRFLCFWTVKEAYLKARGVGLRLPLHDITVRLPGEPMVTAPVTPGLVLGPGVHDDASAWQVRLLAPDETHVVSVAARGDALDVKVTWATG